MSLPFTVNQFLDVFRDYNLSIWPTQIIAYILAILAFVLIFSQRHNKNRVASFILSIFWIWNGVAYHLLNFSRINKAAFLFGALFLIQGILFFVYGTLRNKITFNQKNLPRTIVGSVIIVYAAVIYPLVGYLLGHGYPYSPLLGVAPCPTTIFTFGLLIFTKQDIPFNVLWIPVFWSLVGSNAAWAFGIWEDIGMLTAMIISLALIIFGKYTYKRESSDSCSGKCDNPAINNLN